MHDPEERRPPKWARPMLYYALLIHVFAVVHVSLIEHLGYDATATRAVGALIQYMVLMPLWEALEPLTFIFVLVGIGGLFYIVISLLLRFIFWPRL
ncbi:MAG: hypothetical protein ACLGH6_12170 [Gammaproteobacteria bacterium]